MKRNRILFSFLILVFAFLFTAFVKVDAKELNVSDEIKIEEVSIRTEGELGLTFKANVNTFDITNVKKYGILLAYGNTDANNNFIKDGSINNKVIINGEVNVTDNGYYTVTLVKIPKDSYIQNVTARAYVVLNDEEIVYASSVVTTSIGNQALDDKISNTETNESKDIINYIDDNFVVVGMNNMGNYSVSTSLYEKNRIKLYNEFIKDYNKLFNEDVKSFTPLEFFEALKSNKENNLSGSRLYKFFNDESLYDKWMWLIDYFHTCEELRDVVNQAEAVQVDGTCGTRKLSYGEHLIYSIYNFFNATSEKGHYRSIPFTNLYKYQDVVKDSKVLINFDSDNLMKVGSSIKVPDKPEDKNGYKWNSFKVNDKSYEANSNYVLENKDIEFVPTYDIVDYSIKYMDGGDEITTTNPNIYNIESEDIILNEYVKKGFTFEGWYDNPGFTGEKITTIENGSYGDLVLYAKMVEIGTRVENTDKDLKEFFNKLGTIERNINLPIRNDKEDTTITWSSSNPNIISNTGKLKRDYKKSVVTLTAGITCGEHTFYFTYDVNVMGYKELTNIASSYIYTNYGYVTPLFFDTLDIINCAFVVGNANGTLTGSNFFRNVTNNIMDKAHEQGIYVVASIGPGSDWTEFANPANGKIELFADNVVKMINKYGFDGIDLDWECPNSGQYEWFTQLSKAIYKKVKANNPNHLVTAAIGGGMWQPGRYDLKNSKKYLDYINLMCYGMVNNTGRYQNALYRAPSYYDSKNKVGATTVSCSIDESVKYYKDNFNIDGNQLIAGFAFYAMVQERTYENGKYSEWKHDYSTSFTDIKNNFLTDSNYTEVYDERACVPYIISKDGLTFISYDNPRSIKDKAKYTIEHKLAGLMYWQNGQDKTDTLLGALKEGLGK